MQQLVLKDGSPTVVEVPAPQLEAGRLLVAVSHSSISAGTELSVLRSTERGWVNDLLEHPRRVKRALVLARAEGVRAGRRKLLNDYLQSRALGYSVAGRVLAVGRGVDGFSPGDLVACAGAQCAFHASVVSVPKNLCVRLPEGVGLKEASTVALGAIALHAVRQVNPGFGDAVGVAGLGLLGMLSAQLLRSSGCRVLTWDPRPERVALARKLGFESDETPPDHLASSLDAVLLAASTDRSDVLGQCADLTRHKGRIVLLGNVPVRVDRWRIYEKEIELRMSTSYGPGRYDADYEEKGMTYPPGYVPWTETRNMQAYLQALSSGQVTLQGLSSSVIPVSEGARAYQQLKSQDPPLLLHLSFPEQAEKKPDKLRKPAPCDKVQMALVGLGQFAQSVHLPNLEKLRDRISLHTIVTRNGLKAKTAADLHTAIRAGTSFEEVLRDDEITAVLLATRHDAHARMTASALLAHKHVFVEKPLAISWEGYQAVKDSLEQSTVILMTGFNRALAPSVVALSRFLARRNGPVVINYRMNAGRLPPDHWLYSTEGGGRNLGEACHIYHLFLHLIGNQVVSVQAVSGGGGRSISDNFLVNLRFEDGSLAHLCYQSEGSHTTAKERMEGFVDGHTFLLDDYRSMHLFGPTEKSWVGTQDKGHLALLRAFATAIRGGEALCVGHQLEATRIALVVEDQLRGSA